VYLQSPTEVLVVSAEDGTELWRRSGSLLDLADTDGIVLVHTGPGVDAVAVEGGETVWSAAVADQFRFVLGGLGDSGRVILADSETSLVEYDRTTGDQLWRHETSPGISAVTSTLAAVRHKADSYLILDNGGNVLAEHDMDAGGWLATIDDQLVELRFAGGLRGIDADTGAYAWELPNAIPAQSFGDLYSGASRLPPALVAGTNIDGVEVVGMIDPGTGQPRWQMRANTDLRTAVAGDVYVVLVRATGVTTWHDRQTGRTAATVIIRNPQILSDDPAVVLSDNSLIGLDLAN
jgi:outer membrane protein assembly factor BamB